MTMTHPHLVEMSRSGAYAIFKRVLDGTIEDGVISFLVEGVPAIVCEMKKEERTVVLMDGNVTLLSIVIPLLQKMVLANIVGTYRRVDPHS